VACRWPPERVVVGSKCNEKGVLMAFAGQGNWERGLGRALFLLSSFTAVQIGLSVGFYHIVADASASDSMRLFQYSALQYLSTLTSQWNLIGLLGGERQRERGREEGERW
jgi:hypothetical protein